MKKFFLAALSLATIILFAPSCIHTPKDDGLACDHAHHNHGAHDGHDHEDHDGHDHEDHEDHDGHDHEEHEGHDHEGHAESASHSAFKEIILEPERAELFGVKTAKVEPSEFAQVVKVSGQIVPAPTDRATVAAPSSGIVTFAGNIAEGSTVAPGALIATISARGISGGDSNESARIALDAAKRELDRIKPLHAEGIVSTLEYNAALQTYQQAKAAYSGSESGSRAVARTKGVITDLLVRQGEYVEAGTPIAYISGNTRMTLKAEVPEKYSRFVPQIKSANFRPSYSDETIALSDCSGRLISGAASSAVSQNGYIPVYFSFDNRNNVVPGAYAEVYLIGTSRSSSLSVPIQSLNEQQGKYFVYVKVDDEGYEKRPVTIGGSDGLNVEILSGIAPDEEVVTEGVTFVRLAETSGVVPEGHSHTH